jgi:membrane protein CcdC involved in cytochrome C biogenesis
MRQRRAVIHAPTPKKKITNPGNKSSSRNNASPIINHITSGFEIMDVLTMSIVCQFYLWNNCLFEVKDNQLIFSRFNNYS